MNTMFVILIQHIDEIDRFIISECVKSQSSKLDHSVNSMFQIQHEQKQPTD